jgi:indole-3-glycerol phosphate synthase
MSDILQKICADKLNHIAQCKIEFPLEQQIKNSTQAPTPRGFIKALKAKADLSEYGLIAEIKKASPSKGLIRENFSPASLARAYQAGGASCLSILTDIPYFQGQNSFLTAARMAVDLPVLRKDFMLDIYQVYEARAIGADCILLIMAALEDQQATDLEALAHELDMDVLVEVHNAPEMERALKLKTPLLGINNRNLKTMAIDLAITEDLAGMVDKDHLLVSESGLHSSNDLARMAKAGAKCFLVGESLMRQDDVCAATQTLLTS